MALKGWVINRVNRLFTRVDLPPRAQLPQRNRCPNLTSLKPSLRDCGRGRSAQITSQ